MSSHELSVTNSDSAQIDAHNHVVVTGAGFTRAFVPGAPLLVDDFSNDALEFKVRGLPYASRLLDWERSRNPGEYINIERLMTRLDSLMPYDYAENIDNATNEYGFLLSELKRAFLNRLHEARKGKIYHAELEKFANYCKTNHCCCITFNYDDFLDEALAKTGSWNPTLGYGFHCQSSQRAVSSVRSEIQDSALQLLKLHGSINWRAKLGYSNPIAVDNITHHHDWSGIGSDNTQISDHLEPEPVIVPPVLSKSSLVEQPVLRLVWSHAFAKLKTAQELTFIGYSFPTTDMAVRTLIFEALKDLSLEKINVVNLSGDYSESEVTRERYREVFGSIPDRQFHFDGALKWIRNLPLS